MSKDSTKQSILEGGSQVICLHALAKTGSNTIFPVNTFFAVFLFTNLLGLGYVADGKLKKAKAHFKSHLEKFPDDQFAKAQLGYLLYSEKHYEQALPLLLDGIRNDEGTKVNPKFYRYAGESLTKLNHSDEVRCDSYSVTLARN